MLKKLFLILALIMLTATSVEAADSNVEVLATTYTEGDNAELAMVTDGNGHIFFAVQDVSNYGNYGFNRIFRKSFDFL